MKTSLPGPLLQIERAALATSVGDDARTTVAAMTAGMQRFIRQEADGRQLTIAPAPDLVGQRTGVARLAALLHPALSAVLDFQDDALDHKRSQCLVAVPTWLTASERTELSAAIGRLCTQQLRGQIRVHLFAGGFEASYTALQSAFAAIAARPSGPDGEPLAHRIVLAGVDSLCEPVVLRRDDAAGRVHQPGNGNGWVAGEGAAALLLSPVSGIRVVPTGRFALHHPAIEQAQPGAPARWPSDVQGDGRVLEQVLDKALAHAGMTLQNISHGFADIDGSDWRAEDLFGALHRIQAKDGEDWNGAAVEPALRTGQLGAAWGVIQWALAANLHALGQEQINTVLSFNLDPSGACAATVMERSPL